jgi:hypothetical protein
VDAPAGWAVGRASESAAAAAGAWTTLRDLCAAAVQAASVNGAAVSVMTGAGHSGLLHATDALAGRLDEVQFELGEGPSRDAFRHGYPVLVPALDDGAAPREAGRRWPAFARAAHEAGAGAVFALPLQLGAIQVGVLLLYRTDPRELTSAELAGALRIADTVTYALVNMFNTEPAAGDSNQAAAEAGEGEISVLIEAEETVYRSVVHQATGMVSVQLGVTLDEALARLRAHAFAEATPITDVARAIVTRTLRLGA